jgi:methyl coenzyme M reductase subunit C-like uncharacterized protein (methanogenesis marker protein 7)
LVDLPHPVALKLDGVRVEVTFEKTAQGVRARRKITQDVGVTKKADYPALRDAVEAFRRGRREVLVFAPKRLAAQ